MKLIEPEVSLIEESNPYRKVEKIGRICYKSEDKITDTSYVNDNSGRFIQIGIFIVNCRTIFNVSYKKDLRTIRGIQKVGNSIFDV